VTPLGARPPFGPTHRRTLRAPNQPPTGPAAPPPAPYRPGPWSPPAEPLAPSAPAPTASNSTPGPTAMPGLPPPWVAAVQYGPLASTRPRPAGSLSACWGPPWAGGLWPGWLETLVHTAGYTSESLGSATLRSAFWPARAPIIRFVVTRLTLDIVIQRCQPRHRSNSDAEATLHRVDPFYFRVERAHNGEDLRWSYLVCKYSVNQGVVGPG